MDRPRRLGRDMAGDSAGEGELAEQFAQSLDVFADSAVHLGVGALEVGIGDQTGAAVTGPGDVDDAGVAVADDAVQVRVDEVEAGRGAPVS